MGIAIAIVLPAVLVGATAEAAASNVKVGSNLGSASKLASLGAKPDTAVFWVGIWTKKDWSAVDRQLERAKSLGVTPVIQWYYWGDDISPTCVENGCYSTLHGGWKSKSDWNAMAATLAKKIAAVMGTQRTVVILETEFNKQGIQSYEAFDGYLAAQATTFRTYAPSAKLTLGFGNWGWSYYKNFDRAIAKVDHLGTQSLSASTRDSDSAYLNSVSQVVKAAGYLRTNFGKPVHVTDMGWSSYPEPKYADYQERMVKEAFSRMGELASNGVVMWSYRSIFDNPKMNTANYYGQAERHWGFIRSDGSWKPAMNDFVAGIKALRAGALGPGTIQAERFAYKSTGWEKYDTAAENDRVWVLGRNGHVSQSVMASSSGTHALTVKAKGQMAGADYPTMVMHVDGKEVGRWHVRTSDAYWTYTAKVWFNAGQTKQVRVSFVNDYYDSETKADRNLYLDLMRFGLSSTGGTSGSREAEDMRYRSVGARHSDARASGGASWNLWSNGHVRDTVRVAEAGEHKLTVKAKGQLAGDRYPRMVLRVDGQVAGAWDVRTSDAYWTYSVTRSLAAGDHEVSVEFVNDWYDPAVGDRNLLVDRVEWTKAS